MEKLYCYNCKHELNNKETLQARNDAKIDVTALNYSLCGHCSDKQYNHQNYINSFGEGE